MGHVPTSRVAGWNDFLWGLASPISPGDESGFEAFPAVYRAPSLFGHPLVMNFQEFMDIPETRRQPRCSQSRFHVSRPGGIPVSLRREPGATTLPRRGLVGPCIAVGAEILGFTAAFLRGLGFFSLSDLAIHPDLESWFYHAAVGIPLGTSAFAAAPCLLCPRALRSAVWAVPVFSERYLEDRVFLGEGCPSSLGGLTWGEPRGAVGLDSSGLPVGGRIPPGGYPSPRCSSIARGV